jgi:hypothetical protein
MRRASIIIACLAMVVGHAAPAHADLDGFLPGLNVQAKADLRGFSLKLAGQFGVGDAEVQRVIRSLPERGATSARRAAASDSERAVNVAEAKWGHASYRRRLASQKSHDSRDVRLLASRRQIVRVSPILEVEDPRGVVRHP